MPVAGRLKPFITKLLAGGCVAAAASMSSTAFMANTHVLYPRAQPPPQDRPSDGLSLDAGQPSIAQDEIQRQGYRQRLQSQCVCPDSRDLQFQDHCKTETNGQLNEYNEHNEYQHTTYKNNCTIKIICIMVVDKKN